MFVPEFKGKAFSFYPLSIILAAGFSYMALIMLRYVPSIPTLLSYTCILFDSRRNLLQITYKLSSMWYNVDCSQLMSQFDHYQLQLWSIVQREIPSMKLHKPLLTHSISHSTFSIHCTSLFCVFQLCFYRSLNNKA